LLFLPMVNRWTSKLIWTVSSSSKPTCRTSFGLVITWMFWFQLMDSNNRIWQCLSRRIQSGRKSSSRNERISTFIIMYICTFWIKIYLIYYLIFKI
jgi:hypothetical protein